MERLGRPASSQYRRLGRSESLDRLLGSAAWANEIEPAARDSPMPQQPQPQKQQQQQGRGRLLRSRSLPDLLGLRRRAVHWKALSWLLDPAGGRRKVGSLEYLKDPRKVPAGGGDQSCCRSPNSNVTSFSKSTDATGRGAAAEDDKHNRKKQRPKNKKRSSWLPDPDRRWPIQGW